MKHSIFFYFIIKWCLFKSFFQNTIIKFSLRTFLVMKLENHSIAGIISQNVSYGDCRIELPQTLLLCVRTCSRTHARVMSTIKAILNIKQLTSIANRCTYYCLICTCAYKTVK